MASNLNAEFERGRMARMEGATPDTCPYLATSDCADAWHAGHAYEGINSTTRMTVDKVTHGRGYRVNVAGRNPGQAGWPNCKMFFLIDYQENSAPIVSRSTAMHPSVCKG